MQKTIFFFAVCSLSISILSCSKDSESSSPPKTKIEYGHEVPPGDLPELPVLYRPKDLNNKVFTANSQTYAPIDLDHQILSLTFDAVAQTIRGQSKIFLHMNEAGLPYFQFSGTVLSAKWNSQSVGFSTIHDPHGLGLPLVAILQSLQANDSGTLEIEYQLSPIRANFQGGGVGFLTDMSDLTPSRFFERWGPGGFEDDSFSMTMNLKVLNSQSAHQIFTNGIVNQKTSFEWQVDFPSSFTTSSIYIHLSNQAFAVERFHVPGKTKPIPITVYSADQNLVTQARQMLPGLFSELENDYGPYAHSAFTAYITASGGGMEYSGATITSLRALGHELFHSWFARGVMPAEGRSGWIDEAMASWRDYGYFQASSLLSRAPTVLASFSPYRQSTAVNSYTDGRQFMSELDVFFANFGGMKPLMKEFFARYKQRVVTTEEFQNFLNLRTGKDVNPFFDRYVYSSAGTGFAVEKSAINDSLHPPPMTEEDARRLR